MSNPLLLSLARHLGSEVVVSCTFQIRGWVVEYNRTYYNSRLRGNVTVTSGLDLLSICETLVLMT